MSKPSIILTWVSSNIAARFSQPDPNIIEQGYSESEQPDHAHFNWLIRNIYQWLGYFNSVVTNLEGSEMQYDAFVGAGGTHADFNALMNDENIANIKRVFVKNSLALETTQVITKDNLEIIFAAGASILKINGLTKAFQITANRVSLRCARFESWEGAGDLCIELTNTSKNCFIEACSFFNCTNYIQDDGINNHQQSNRKEV